MAQQALVLDPNISFVLKLNVRSLELTDEQLLQLSSDNECLRLELTAEGELVVMPPVGLVTSWRNAKIAQRLANWTDADGTGIAFDSSAGFRLPNGAILSPDASWARRERWEALSRSQRQIFAPLCPDFVLELRSPSDRLPTVQAKMVEYMENGARLGWLIDPIEKCVHIYRPEQPVDILRNPENVSGEPVLPGFVPDVREIFAQP
jgi:Uma2 family endonuclease